MKQTIILIIGGLLLSVNAFSQSSDQEAIKKVCLSETQAYIDFNYDSWASFHVQSPDEQLAWNNPDGTYGSEVGWESISKGIKDYFKTAQKESLKMSNEKFTYVIRGEMAFAAFKRSTQNQEGKTTQIQEYRTLLKLNGIWKILAVQAYVNYPSEK